MTIVSEWEDVLVIELPYTAGVVVHVRHEQGKYEFTFFQHEIKVFDQIIEEINEDSIVELLAESGIEYTSFSAISGISTALVKQIDEKNESYNVSKEKERVSSTDAELEMIVKDSIDEIYESENIQNDVQTEVKETIIDTEGATQLKNLPVPYEEGSILEIFWYGGKNYLITYKSVNGLISSEKITSDMEDSTLFEIFRNIGIDFFSMAVGFELAENLIEIMKDPGQYISMQKEENLIESVHIDGEIAKEEIIEKDTAISIDPLNYREPEDVERFILDLRKASTSQDSTVLMKEIPVKGVKQTICKIWRRGDTWLFSFYKKGKEVTSQTKLKSVTREDTFKMINNGVPQISLSHVDDATDHIWQILKSLASRTQEDLLITQVVSHFTNVIEDHEAKNEKNKAQRLSKALLDKFIEMNNGEGIYKFGVKVANYYEIDKKFKDSASLRIRLAETLFEEGDLTSIKEFVDDCLNFFSRSDVDQNMDAAKLAVKFTDKCIELRDLSKASNYALKAARFYKNANLPIALTDLTSKYGEILLKMTFGEDELSTDDKKDIEVEEEEIFEQEKKEEKKSSYRFDRRLGPQYPDLQKKRRKEQEEGKKGKKIKTGDSSKTDTFLSTNEISDVKNDVVELIDITLDAQEERKDKYEFVELLKTSIKWFRIYNLLDEELKFTMRAFNYFEEEKDHKRSISLGTKMVHKLMKNKDHIKGMELSNTIIKVFWSTKELPRAIDLAYIVVEYLIALKEKEPAYQYLNFAMQLIEKAFDKKETDKIIDCYVRNAKYLMDLKLPNEALKQLKTTLVMKKTNIEEFLEFVNLYMEKFIADEKFELAQEFVNSAMTELGTKKISNVAGLSISFADTLFKYKNFKFGIDYYKYGYQCFISSPDRKKIVKILQDRILKNLSDEDLVNITEKLQFTDILIQILVSEFQQTKDFTTGISSLMEIIDRILELELYNEAFNYLMQLKAFQETLGDQKGIIDVMEQYRPLFLSENASVQHIKEITDILLKGLVDQEKKFKEGIKILEPLIQKLLDNKLFDESYIYCIKLAQYYENTKDIKGATTKLSNFRNQFIDNDRISDADNLTDFVVRINVSNKKSNEAFELAYNFASKLFDLAQYDIASRHFNSAIKIKRSTKGFDESVELIEDIYKKFLSKNQKQIEIFIEEKNNLYSESKKFKKDLNQRIIENYETGIENALKSELFTVANSFMAKSLKILEEMPEIIRITAIESHVNRLFDYARYPDAKPFVINLIDVKYNKKAEDADEYSYNYVQRFLKAGEVGTATTIIENIIEQNKKDSIIVLKYSLKFVKQLVSIQLIGNAREYIDKTILLFDTPKSSKEDIGTSSSICSRFAILIINYTPELAMEYTYRAADYARKTKDINLMAQTYIDIAKEFPLENSIRILKRGLFDCKQSSADPSTIAKVQNTLTKNSIRFTKQSDIEGNINKTLEFAAATNDFQKAYSLVEEVFQLLILYGRYEQVITYLEYFKNMAKLNKDPKRAKILLMGLINRLEEKRDKKNIDIVLAANKEILGSEPSNKEIVEFFRELRIAEGIEEKEITLEEKPIMKVIEKEEEKVSAIKVLSSPEEEKVDALTALQSLPTVEPEIPETTKKEPKFVAEPIATTLSTLASETIEEQIDQRDESFISLPKEEKIEMGDKRPKAGISMTMDSLKSFEEDDTQKTESDIIKSVTDDLSSRFEKFRDVELSTDDEIKEKKPEAFKDTVIMDVIDSISQIKEPKEFVEPVVEEKPTIDIREEIKEEIEKHEVVSPKTKISISPISIDEEYEDEEFAEEMESISKEHDKTEFIYKPLEPISLKKPPKPPTPLVIESQDLKIAEKLKMGEVKDKKGKTKKKGGLNLDSLFDDALSDLTALISSDDEKKK